MILFVLPFLVGLGAALTLCVSAVVGFCQTDRRAGTARAGRLMAMWATCLFALGMVWAFSHSPPSPEYLNFTITFTPFVAGCWLGAVMLEKKGEPDRSQHSGFNSHRFGP
ncbi:MAG: hypothetical protein U0931_01290 [Vulcanimicrobiota bacterium]